MAIHDRERITEFFSAIVHASDGAARIAFNEEDATTDAQPEAQHFLKINEKRLGRNIELYAFMIDAAGRSHVLADFAELTLALPSDRMKWAAFADLRILGRDWLHDDADAAAKWTALLDDLTHAATEFR